MLKIVGIGDLFIPAAIIKAALTTIWSSEHVQIDTFDWSIHDFETLQNINRAIEQDGANAYTESNEDILRRCQFADIIVTQFYPISKDIMNACKGLKMIGVLRSGYENVDVAYATQKNILVFNTPGRNADSVADFTVGLMLSEARNIARGHLGIKTGKWIRNYPNSGDIPDLPGKTIGLVGFGEIGRKVAKRLRGFDVNILVYDPYMQDSIDDVTFVGLEQLMSESDFVSIHVKQTKETFRMIDMHLLSIMKPTAYLINTARSSIVDENALYEILTHKKIAGAGIDVFDSEPISSSHPLVNLENVTLTPHMAGGSNDAFKKSPIIFAQSIINAKKDRQPKNLINLADLDRFWHIVEQLKKGE